MPPLRRLALRVLRQVAFTTLQHAQNLVNGAQPGTKGMVVTEDGRVLLVWHSYLDGWQLPGGSCHKGEPTAEACARVLREETGVIVEGGAEGLRLQGRYRWGSGAVDLFVAERWTQEITSNLEITSAKFFPMHDLPKGTTAATRRRVKERQEGGAVTGRW